MAVELIELVPYLKASVNPPGQEFLVASDNEWRTAAANAFWWARLRGFFPEYRVDVDGEVITNTEDPTVDMPREQQQIIVLAAALNAIEAQLLAMPTSTRAKAGPVESETGRSAQVLTALLRNKRDELAAIKDELVGTSGATAVGVIDAVLAREGAFCSGEAVFVR
jgi:hypothetical protein